MRSENNSKGISGHITRVTKMNKLEQAADEYSSNLNDSSHPGYAFIAGALWLLEQARKLAYTEPNGMATEEIAFYEQLKELSQSEHKEDEQ